MGATVAAAGNPHGAPPGQAKADGSQVATTNGTDQQATGAGQSWAATGTASSSTGTASSTGAGKFAGCTASPSQGQGVKPNNTTEKWTCATAGSGQTKLYGNGTTAGQIAINRGAPASTVLYGPGNSQPHKVAVCKHGKTHLVDVHAVKSYANVGACTTAGVHSNSTSSPTAGQPASTAAANASNSASAALVSNSSSNSAASAATVTPAPSIQVAKNERDQTTGAAFSAGPIDVKVGDRVDYQITIYNNGKVDLTAHLVDPGCIIRGGHTLDFSGISLKVGETKLYHCSHLITAADAPTYTNTAIANGVAADTSLNASSSVAATPTQATVRANIAGVLGAHKVLATHKTIVHRLKKVVHTHKAPKKVVVRAKPAAPKVKAATFTG